MQTQSTPLHLEDPPDQRTPRPTHRAGSDHSAPTSPPPRRNRWFASVLLIVLLAALAAGLAMWKRHSIAASNAAAAQQQEPVEVVVAATAQPRGHQRTTTSIGTVLALRSTTLRNEIPGTVREVNLTPGQVVEEGTLLVALDVSVEEAELRAAQAQAALAETLAQRVERAVQSRATSQIELDRAQADLNVARAQIARLEAVIARKTIRAPFRARIGLSDVHPGQFLDTGTLLTTLQGVDEAANVDFAVPQQVAQQLSPGQRVEVLGRADRGAVPAEIVALDAKVDPATRNTTVRARVDNAAQIPGPGASVRVQVPSGAPFEAVVVPANTLRKGPAGDHVFVVAPDAQGKLRAQMRRVRPGPALGDEILILEGLEAGEKVAALGSFKLREGALVALADATPPAAGGAPAATPAPAP